jgi:hypothetical protein
LRLYLARKKSQAGWQKSCLPASMEWDICAKNRLLPPLMQHPIGISRDHAVIAAVEIS